ncbi:MAG: recombination protein RecR [Candidatus Krumholzibacteriota bacterium]|nr:recombination protein RecR [Candidatus Krumholzibacteriota bacterium]
MAIEYGSETLTAVVRAFSRLPGIGTKTAQRLALHLLRSPGEEAENLSHLLAVLREKVRFCRICGSITEADECAICKDPGREKAMLCVVEQPQDVFYLEKTRQFRGLYHVLHGVLSPIDGVGPDDLNLGSIETRVREGLIREVVVATNPTVEGDTTALYIAKSLSPHPVSVTRLARGLPMGITLEFADDSTLARAIERREEL